MYIVKYVLGFEFESYSVVFMFNVNHMVAFTLFSRLFETFIFSSIVINFLFVIRFSGGTNLQFSRRNLKLSFFVLFPRLIVQNKN